MQPASIPILLHLLIETPGASSQIPPYFPSPPSLTHVVYTTASLSFLLRPQVQLRQRDPSPLAQEAALICRSYGGLLLATNLFCAHFLLRDTFDEVSVALARSLALYHVFPIARAWARIRQGGRHEDALGGPVVHLLVHVILLASLLWAGGYGTASI